MSNEIIKQELISRLVLEGDISRMTQEQKVQYYNQFCQSLGLNALTQPFQIIKFQGRERLYATKDCTEQLRKLHGVSITDVSSIQLNGVFVVTAKAQDKTGKTDAATGAVPIEGLKGDALANALMKAETKAKRRVTLSICGLGLLDESEMETMKGAETGGITVSADSITITNEVPTEDERQLLRNLLYNSTLEGNDRENTLIAIDTCQSYKKYDYLRIGLEDRQIPIDQITNPLQRDINNHLKKTVKA